MYQRAIKLQEIITNVQLFLSFGEEQLDSYSIAINALLLVDEHSQWVILPVVGETVSEIFFYSFACLTLHRLANVEPRQDTFQSRSSHLQNMKPKLSTLPTYSASTLCCRLKLPLSNALPNCSTLQVASHFIALSEGSSLKFSEFLLPPSVLVLRLVHLNLFSQALTVANALNVDMTELFTNLTAQCIRLSKNSQTSLCVPIS